MNTALVIMAAGIGSRYGAGIKQLEKMDSHNHIIMDYAIHDAIAAGFQKIIFIIRKDIQADFRDIIGNRIETVCKQCGVEVFYAFQDSHDIPADFPEGRTKPWGTGQAVLAAKPFLHEPFAIVNADDYYGREAYQLVHDHLIAHPDTCCMAGFILRNTLSENGSVTRGICKVDNNGMLSEIVETRNIFKTANGAESNGIPLDINCHVSMNMFGFSTGFLPMLEQGFSDFFRTAQNLQKDEYLIPVFVGQLLKKQQISVRVLETHDSWFGVTYAEDAPYVKACFRKLIDDGIYPEDLYSDLL